MSPLMRLGTSIAFTPPPRPGGLIYIEGRLSIEITPAGELCAAISLVDGDVDGEQVLNREDAQRLHAALEQWLYPRYELTSRGRAALREEADDAR